MARIGGDAGDGGMLQRTGQQTGHAEGNSVGRNGVAYVHAAFFRHGIGTQSGYGAGRGTDGDADF